MPDSSAAVHVVAGVIRDALGRILLARRTEGRDLAGLWEFPGGKVEPGETPEAALVRELHEELGIGIDIGAALMTVPQAYPHKRLRLDVRHIKAWHGTLKNLDGQALAWVPPDKLAGYAMPPADRPVIAALLQPDRYLVTPEPGDGDDAWLSALRRALDAGIRRVQLRARDAEPSRWRRLATLATEICREANAEVFINADAALAAELGIGVHLRASQLHVRDAHPDVAGQSVIASCHTREDLLAAERLGCDAVVLGPVLPTPTHPDAPGIGWSMFAALREHVALPIYAIGGMTPGNIDEARHHGAQGIAAMRSLWPLQEHPPGVAPSRH